MEARTGTGAAQVSVELSSSSAAVDAKYSSGSGSGSGDAGLNASAAVARAAVSRPLNLRVAAQCLDDALYGRKPWAGAVSGDDAATEQALQRWQWYHSRRWRSCYTALCILLLCLTFVEPPSSLTGGYFMAYNSGAANAPAAQSKSTATAYTQELLLWQLQSGSGGGSGGSSTGASERTSGSSTGTSGSAAAAGSGGSAGSAGTDGGTTVLREYTPSPGAVSFAFECLFMLLIGLDFVFYVRAFAPVIAAANTANPANTANTASSSWWHHWLWVDRGGFLIRAMCYSFIWIEALAYAGQNFTTTHPTRSLRPLLLLTVDGPLRNMCYGLAYVFVQLRAALLLSAFFVVWFGVIGFLLFTNALPDGVTGGAYDTFAGSMYSAVIMVTTWSSVVAQLKLYWVQTRFSFLFWVCGYFVVALFVFKIIVQVAFREWKEFQAARKTERATHRKSGIELAFKRMGITVPAPAPASVSTSEKGSLRGTEQLIEQSTFVSVFALVRPDVPRDFLDLLYTKTATDAAGLSLAGFIRCVALLKAKINKQQTRAGLDADNRHDDCCDRISACKSLRSALKRPLTAGLDLSFLRTGIGMSYWNVLFAVATILSVVETVVSSHNSESTAAVGGAPSDGSGIGWPAVGVILTISFTAKFLIEMVVYGFRRYFTVSYFHALEFVCTLSAITYFAINGVSTTNKRDSDFPGATAALIFLRVIRMLRLFSVFQPFEDTLRAIRRTASTIGNLLVFLYCVTYTWAIWATALFTDTVQPNNPAIGATSKWGKIGIALGYGDHTASLITTYQVSQWSSWINQLVPVQQTHGQVGLLYLVSWRYFIAVVVLPMSFGVIMETLNSNLAVIQAAADKKLKAKQQTQHQPSDAGGTGTSKPNGDASKQPANASATATGSPAAPSASPAPAGAKLFPVAASEAAVVPSTEAGVSYHVKLRRADSLVAIAATAAPAPTAATAAAAAPAAPPGAGSQVATTPQSPPATAPANITPGTGTGGVIAAPRSPLSINTALLSPRSQPSSSAEPSSPTSPGGSKLRGRRNQRARDAEDLVVTVLGTRADPTGALTPVYGPAVAVFAFPTPVTPAIDYAMDSKTATSAATATAVSGSAKAPSPTVAALPDSTATPTITMSNRFTEGAHRPDPLLAAAAIEDALAARPLSSRYGFEMTSKQSGEPSKVAHHTPASPAERWVDMFHGPVWRFCYSLSIAVALIVLPIFEPTSTVTPRSDYPSAPATAVAFEFVLLAFWCFDLLMTLVTTPSSDRRARVYTNKWYLLRAVAWLIMFIETCVYTANDFPDTGHVGRCLRPLMIIAYPGRVRKYALGIVVTLYSMGWVFFLLGLHVTVFALFGYLWLDNQTNNTESDSGGSGGVTGFYQTVGQSFYNTLLELTAFGNTLATQLPYFTNSRWNFVYFFLNFTIGNLFVFRIVAATGLVYYKKYLTDERNGRKQKRERLLAVAWQLASVPVTTVTTGGGDSPSKAAASNGAASPETPRVMTLSAWRSVAVRVRRGLLTANLTDGAAEALFCSVCLLPQACVYSSASKTTGDTFTRAADGTTLGVNRIGFQILVRLINAHVSSPRDHCGTATSPANGEASLNPITRFRALLRRVMEADFTIAATASRFAYYQLIVQAFVILAAVQLVMSAITAANSEGGNPDSEWTAFGNFLLATFAAQVVLELFVYATDYFRSAFRCLDLLVLIGGIIGAGTAGEVSTFALMFRLLRLLRLLTIFKAVEETTQAVRRSISVVLDVIFVMFCLMFFYAIIGQSLYATKLVQSNPLLTPGYTVVGPIVGFDDYQNSLCTLIHESFWSGWSNVLESAVAVNPDDLNQQNIAYVYFWSWRMLVGVVFLPAMFSTVFESLNVQIKELEGKRLTAPATSPAAAAASASATATKPIPASDSKSASTNATVASSSGAPVTLAGPSIAALNPGQTLFVICASPSSSDAPGIVELKQPASTSARAHRGGEFEYNFRVHLRRTDSFAAMFQAQTAGGAATSVSAPSVPSIALR